MITFDNVLDETCDSILQWNGKEHLNSVTIIRDVFGKISLLLDNSEILKEESESLSVQLEQRLNNFFSKKIYLKKLSRKHQKEAERTKIIIEMIESERKEWKSEEGIIFYISERPIAKKAWVKQTSLQNGVWPYEKAVEENGTKVVTFYSFKGGMGRTTALAGTALALVNQGFNVLMLDTDIEAPGLATLFFDENVVERGVLDYLLEHPLAPERNVREYILDVTDPVLLNEKDGNLYLMPAGKVDEYYLQKLARIDYQDHREGYLEGALKGMLNAIRDNYAVDYILIDARAGFHDMGGIVVSQIPHGAILFGNNSRQSWDGMTQVLRTIAEGHNADWPILIVDSMCEKPTSANYAKLKSEFMEKAYTVCMEYYYDSSRPLPGIGADGVAHSPEFVSFDDALLHGVKLFSSGNAEQDEVAKAYKELIAGTYPTAASYKRIAGRIKGWFGEE